MENKRPAFVIKHRDNKKPVQHDVATEWWNTRIIIVGKEDQPRRNNLLINAGYGLGKLEQKGKDLYYTVGTPDYGFLTYILVNTILPTK